MGKVIAGYCEGGKIVLCKKEQGIAIELSKGVEYALNKTNVKQYEVITSKNKSAASTIVRGALGAVFLGPIGILAAASGQGTHVVAVELKNKYKSLIEINDFLYKEFIASMF